MGMHSVSSTCSVHEQAEGVLARAHVGADMLLLRANLAWFEPSWHMNEREAHLLKPLEVHNKHAWQSGKRQCFPLGREFLASCAVDTVIALQDLRRNERVETTFQPA